MNYSINIKDDNTEESLLLESAYLYSSGMDQPILRKSMASNSKSFEK